jgi:hypothetical protein
MAVLYPKTVPYVAIAILPVQMDLYIISFIGRCRIADEMGMILSISNECNDPNYFIDMGALSLI